MPTKWDKLSLRWGRSREGNVTKNRFVLEGRTGTGFAHARNPREFALSQSSVPEVYLRVAAIVSAQVTARPEPE